MMADVKIPKEIYDELVDFFILHTADRKKIETFLRADYKKRCDREAINRAFIEKAQATTEEERKAAEKRIGELMKK